MIEYLVRRGGVTYEIGEDAEWTLSITSATTTRVYLCPSSAQVWPYMAPAALDLYLIMLAASGCNAKRLWISPPGLFEVTEVHHHHKEVLPSCNSRLSASSSSASVTYADKVVQRSSRVALLLLFFFSPFPFFLFFVTKILATRCRYLLSGKWANTRWVRQKEKKKKNIILILLRSDDFPPPSPPLFLFLPLFLIYDRYIFTNARCEYNLG